VTEPEGKTGDRSETKEDGPASGQPTHLRDHADAPLAKEENVEENGTESESSHHGDDADTNENLKLLSSMHKDELRDHHQLSSTLQESKEAHFREKLKAAEAVMEAALNKYVKQLQTKHMPGTDLDHDFVGQDEKPTDSSNAHDERKEDGDEGGSSRPLQAGSAPPSIARDGSATEGEVPVRQRYSRGTRRVPAQKGAISRTHLRPRAGTREGMPVEWSYGSDRLAYSVTMDTAIRLVSNSYDRTNQLCASVCEKVGWNQQRKCVVTKRSYSKIS
jgi:hypothetical protein